MHGQLLDIVPRPERLLLRLRIEPPERSPAQLSIRIRGIPSAVLKQQVWPTIFKLHRQLL